MNLYQLKLITPPAVEPVTVAEVKLHTHIDHDVEDALLTTWIKSGRMLAESFQNRAFITQILEMSFDVFPDLPLLIPRAPLQSIDSLKYFDYLNAETAAVLTDFIIDVGGETKGRIGFAYNKQWPGVTLRSMSAVKIRYTAGYLPVTTTEMVEGEEVTTVDYVANVPETVKDAIMLYCAYRNENRAAEVEAAPKQFYDLLWPDRLDVI
jgi:uncharacterized phiE125 gp8 family phage protein